MNEEIHCITKEEKTVKNEWENDDSDFRSSFIQYIKNKDNSFSTRTRYLA